MINKDDENFIYYTLGQNLKKCRKNKGWSQEKLANEANYNISFIKNLESKKVYQTASIGTAYHLAKILGIHIKDLFEDLEEDN